MNTGELHIIIGSMFSGKTSALIDLYNKLKITDINVIAINYAEDQRYSENLLSTHDKVMIPAINVLHLSNITKSAINNAKYRNSKYILINEAQFFGDLYEFTLNAVEVDRKYVYVYGLDGDFQRDKFGQIMDLIPMSNTITKLQACCHFCPNNGIFSHRLTGDKRQKVIGTSNYVPLCRNCYLSRNMKSDTNKNNNKNNDIEELQDI